MTDYRRVRALLVQLLGLDAVDAQLPLPVIVNLNRRALMAPFERFARDVTPLPDDRTFDGAADYMAQAWPEIHPDLFRGHVLLDALSTQGPDDVPAVVSGNWPKDLGLICQHGLWKWEAYEPLVQLCTFGWPGTDLSVAFQMLELELGLEPRIRELLIHYGQDESC